MRWKWILGIAGAIVAVLIITAYIIIASYDFNKFKPRIVDLAKQYTGRELTLGGDIELGLSLFPTLVVNDVAFENTAWGSSPQMVRVKRLEAQVDLISMLRGDINISRIAINKPEFLIEFDKSGKSNLEFKAPPKPGPEAVEDTAGAGRHDWLKIKEVQIEKGTVSYQNHQSGRTEKFAIEALNLKAPEYGAALEIGLKFIYQKIPFQIRGSLGPISELLNPQVQWPLDLTVTVVGSRFEIAGHIMNITEAKGIDLKLAAKGTDIAGFQQFGGESLPVQGPFEVAARLNARALDDFKISDITILLDQSQISGEIALNRKAARPLINANFHSTKLDLRPFLKQDRNGGEGSQTATGKSETKGDKVFSAEPFDLQTLRQVDAVVSLRADQIFTHRLALEKFNLDLSLKNGHLIVKPLTTDSGGGKVSCKLDLQTKNNQADLTTNITVDKINLAEMLNQLGIAHDLDGVLDVTINLKGRGDSVASLMAGLDGDVVAVLTKARLPVKYLKLVGADLTTSLLKIVNPFEENIESAQFNCAVCDFNIKDGLARSDIIMLDDPDKTLYSAGTINLKTEALDFGIETRPKEGLGTQETGKVSVSLSAITKPFKLGGTLANPKLGISPQGAAKTVASALFRPGGVASLFVTTSSGKQDPCAAALEIAGTGPAKSTKKTGQEKEQEGKDKKKKEGFGSRIKKLFSNPED